MKFRDTGLKGSAELEKAFDASYESFFKNTVTKFESFPEEDRQIVLEQMGIENFGSLYVNSILKMAKLAEEDGLGEDSIISILYAGAAKNDPMIVRTIGCDEIADKVDTIMKWERQLAQGFQDMFANIDDYNDDEDKLKADFAKAVQGTAALDPYILDSYVLLADAMCDAIPDTGSSIDQQLKDKLAHLNSADNEAPQALVGSNVGRDLG